jgi:hypothetical protein
MHSLDPAATTLPRQNPRALSPAALIQSCQHTIDGAMLLGHPAPRVLLARLALASMHDSPFLLHGPSSLAGRFFGRPAFAASSTRLHQNG